MDVVIVAQTVFGGVVMVVGLLVLLTVLRVLVGIRGWVEELARRGGGVEASQASGAGLGWGVGSGSVMDQVARQVMASKAEREAEGSGEVSAWLEMGDTERFDVEGQRARGAGR